MAARGHPFSETGNSFISDVDRDISWTFGTQIDFHLLKQTPSLILKGEVDYRLHDRHLENSI